MNHTNPQGFELSGAKKEETMLEFPTIQLKLKKEESIVSFVERRRKCCCYT